MISIEEQTKLLSELQARPENACCFDCGIVLSPDKNEPTYASVNNGILICEECA